MRMLCGSGGAWGGGGSQNAIRPLADSKKGLAKFKVAPLMSTVLGIFDGLFVEVFAPFCNQHCNHDVYVTANHKLFLQYKDSLKKVYTIDLT